MLDRRRRHSGAVRPLPRPRDVSDHRFARRVSSPSAAARSTPDAPAKYLNSPETPLFHKGATLYNLAAARQAAHDGAHADRGRRLCRRDRDGDRGLCRRGRAARHRADRGSACAALEDGGRADAVLRRRQRRPARGLSRGRLALPKLAARQEPALRAAARRPGPRRSGALRRARSDASKCWTARAAAGRHALDARDREPARSTRRSAARRWRRASASIVAAIGDEAVRKYYRQDFEARLRALFAPAIAPRAFARERDFSTRPAAAGRIEPQFARPRPAAGDRSSPQPVDEFDRARFSQRLPAARGADPARGDQPSLAAGNPCRGIRRAGIPPSRRRAAPPRDPRCRHRPCKYSMPKA